MPHLQWELQSAGLQYQQGTSYEFLHTYATAAPRLLLQLPRRWLQLAGASAAQLYVDFAGLLLCKDAKAC